MMDDVHLAVQLAIGMFFLASAVGKLLDPVGFATGVAEFDLVPAPVAFLGAWLIIATELLLALSHLSGVALGYALPAGLLLLLLFLIAVIYSLKAGLERPCYCFGASDHEPMSARTVMRLLLLLAGELFLIGTAMASTTRLRGLAYVHGAADVALALFEAVFLLVALGWLLGARDLSEILLSDTANARFRERVRVLLHRPSHINSESVRE